MTVRAISGLSQIICYFEKNENHLDDDSKHISRKEFQSAIGKISDNADVILRAVVEDGDSYEHLKSCQSEGRFNDGEVSMRDMYAVRRGSGYKGEDISKQRTRLLNIIGSAYRKNIELEKMASQRCRAAKGLQKITEYFVELSQETMEYSYDILKGEYRWQHVTKHKNKKITKDEYERLEVYGQYSFGGDNWNVSEKTTKDRYFYVSQDGRHNEIEFKEYWAMLGKCAARFNLAEEMPVKAK